MGREVGGETCMEADPAASGGVGDTCQDMPSFTVAS